MVVVFDDALLATDGRSYLNTQTANIPSPDPPRPHEQTTRSPLPPVTAMWLHNTYPTWRTDDHQQKALNCAQLHDASALTPAQSGLFSPHYTCSLPHLAPGLSTALLPRLPQFFSAIRQYSLLVICTSYQPFVSSL